ncbi:MbcA/ParS/Xre antitoxin family protein [Sneathiella chinensis]|uniref:DUF2384 domain-containing protein n=1 Tax=Sneathiella chinensis TaxID=349750 RepID=A0ABQ5U2B0_9PROT|nr:MbcA/ParS/Xre antitoxin family protein [Sneathiella chinensis]GLQ05878.1 hypothetical protein GCM10007924_10990 [Sneathiella chinensis]
MNAALHNELTGAIQPISNRDQIAVIVKALVRTADHWNLTNDEAAALLDVPVATWNRMKKGTFQGNLDRDKATRASLIIGIFKGLRLLFNGPLTHGWVKQPNTGPLFNGLTPLDYMTRGIPALVFVRQHIDALRGGL